jgi:hypothetical protein
MPSFASMTSFRTDLDGLARSESSRFGALSRQSSMSNMNDLKWSDDKLQPSSASSLVDLDAVVGSSNALRWTPLPKISARVMQARQRGGTDSPSTRLNAAPQLGQPTVLAANGIICIGTARGWVMVFDFAQVLKCVCGNEVLGRSCPFLRCTMPIRSSQQVTAGP